MQADLRTGRDMQHIRNFQVFLSKLDEVIHGQQRLIDDAQKRIHREKQHWQQQEQKRMSYSTLEERTEKIQQKKEAKREQFHNDELGARQAFYK
jgi:flagellar FliJ protein